MSMEDYFLAFEPEQALNYCRRPIDIVNIEYILGFYTKKEDFIETHRYSELLDSLILKLCDDCDNVKIVRKDEYKIALVYKDRFFEFDISKPWNGYLVFNKCLERPVDQAFLKLYSNSKTREKAVDSMSYLYNFTPSHYAKCRFCAAFECGQSSKENKTSRKQKYDSILTNILNQM